MTGIVASLALMSAKPLGVIAGAIQIAHLAQEEFMDLGKVGNGIIGFGLLLFTLVLWGIPSLACCGSRFLFIILCILGEPTSTP